MLVNIDWDVLEKPARDAGWDYQRCLYAYVSAGSEIVYIGLAWNATVDQRWQGKRGLWAYLNEQGIIRCTVLLGEVELQGRRLTRQLLGDVESLLIYCEQPCGNIQGRRSRIARPGMRVICSGTWPGQYREYLDR